MNAVPHGDVDLSGNCAHGSKDECKYRQIIYRAGLACTILFACLAALSPFFEAVNRSFWPIKILAVFGMFIGFWWSENDSFTTFSEAARVLSFIWLLVQSVFLVDFAHDIHDLLGEKIADAENDGNDKWWKLLYLLLAIGFYIASFAGIAVLYTDYAGCGLGQFLVTLTLIVGVVTTLLSLWDRVNLGVLTPSIMFAYFVFLCWYALLQSPKKDCNPTAEDTTSDEAITAMTVISLVTFVVLMWMVGAGSKILTIFNPQGHGVMTGKSAAYSAAGHNKSKLNAVLTGETAGVESTQPTASVDRDNAGGDENEPLCGGGQKANKDTGPPQERTFFHALMVFASMYGTMILTSWGAANGASKADNERVANESMWLIIVAQWLTMAMYFRIIQVAYNNDDS